MNQPTASAEPSFKDLTNYIIALGAADISHTDKTYLATCGWYGCHYGEGRTATAVVKYKW